MSEQETQETTEPEGTEQVTEQTTDAEMTDALEADDDNAEDWRKNFDPSKAAARITKLQSEAKNLRERAKTAEQKAAGVDEKDQTITALQATALRYEVGYELGLPRELVNRLHGGTREELIEDAKALVAIVGSPKAAQRKPVEALRGGGQPDQEPAETDLRKIGERMFNR